MVYFLYGTYSYLLTGRDSGLMTYRITGNVGNGQKRLFFLNGDFKIWHLEKYDVITHTAHVNMVSASAIARISRTQVVTVSVAMRYMELHDRRAASL